jgi:hypothetical protein
MASPAQIKANIKYNKSRDSITIRPTKEDGAQIRDDAERAGQSIQNYILQACQERRERDASK